MRHRSLALLAMPIALLSACNGTRQPGATSAAEDRQLDEAAAMQDANSMEVNAIDANKVDADDDNGKDQ